VGEKEIFPLPPPLWHLPKTFYLWQKRFKEGEPSSLEYAPELHRERGAGR